MKLWWCVSVLLSLLVRATTSDVYTDIQAHRAQDFDCYAREVNRLFESIPRWYEPQSETSVILHDSWKPSVRDRPVEKLTRRRGPTQRVEKLPFTVDKRPTTDESANCLHNRSQVTAIYQECIRKQMNETISEPETSDDSIRRFLNYCSRTPQLRQCVKDTIITRMLNCLDEGILETLTNIEQLTNHIIKFICKKEADRVAMFLTDGGLECWKDFVSASRVLVCLNAHLANHVLSSLIDVPALSLVADKCLHLDLADRCVQQELESCMDGVSVLLVSVLFGVAKEVASCDGAATRGSQHRTVSTPGTASTTQGSQHRTVATPSTTTTPELPVTVTQTSPREDNSTSSFQLAEVVTLAVICALVLIALLVARSLKRLANTSPQTASGLEVAASS